MTRMGMGSGWREADDGLGWGVVVVWIPGGSWAVCEGRWGGVVGRPGTGRGMQEMDIVGCRLPRVGVLLGRWSRWGVSAGNVGGRERLVGVVAHPSAGDIRGLRSTMQNSKTHACRRGSVSGTVNQAPDHKHALQLLASNYSHRTRPAPLAPASFVLVFRHSSPAMSGIIMSKCTLSMPSVSPCNVPHKPSHYPAPPRCSTRELEFRRFESAQPLSRRHVPPSVRV